MTEKEPVLAILAAGLGSRYGGLKQVDPIGPNGELIIDYSLYDAKQAGFSRAVFVIKKENESLFEEKIGRRARRLMDVSYAYQDIDDIPQGASVPEGRVKPWGTGHAVYSLRNHISGPFGVINADDFYGRETYFMLYRFLRDACDRGKYDYCMVGFDLSNTLTENGGVSRGVCEVSDEGMLRSVTEMLKIESRGGGVFCEENGKEIELSPHSIASLNVWGFTPSFLRELETGFSKFVSEQNGDPLKREYYLPSAVDALIKNGKAGVKVLKSSEKWYGVTYKDDRERVKSALAAMQAEGKYPPLL
ncbi:MAG: nucleotidyltransferase [Bacillota bacterium]|nr:nucleotidyltransferase [Bacillota bacterium]